jgi:hypothetical protein
MTDHDDELITTSSTVQPDDFNEKHGPNCGEEASPSGWRHGANRSDSCGPMRTDVWIRSPSSPT